MAGREEESSDVEIDGMELDEDCLVRVGRAGAGGAGADAPNPAQKEALESSLSTKEQWTERLAVVDALSVDGQFFPTPDLRSIIRGARTSFRSDVSKTSWIAAQAGHFSCALVLVHAAEHARGHPE